MIRLQGESVLLRAPSPEDQDEFLSKAIASRAHLHPWVHLVEDRVGFMSYLGRANDASTCISLVCRIADGEIIGGCNLGEITLGNLQTAYLGYWCFNDFAGRGYLTEGVGLAQDHAFGSLRLHRLEVNIQPDNAASLAVARRCGFRLEGFSPSYLRVGGEWRDHERWAMTAEAWADRRRS